MVNNVRPNYVNPLTMMKNSRQAKTLNFGAMNKDEKKQKALETEKQSIQNSLLLMKGTSGNGETSEESIEVLEKKLEEITNEIKMSRQETVGGAPAKEKDVEEKSNIQEHFDLYKKTEQDESTGFYRIVNDEEEGYKIEYDGIEGK